MATSLKIRVKCAMPLTNIFFIKLGNNLVLKMPDSGTITFKSYLPPLVKNSSFCNLKNKIEISCLEN